MNSFIPFLLINEDMSSFARRYTWKVVILEFSRRALRIFILLASSKTVTVRLFLWETVIHESHKKYKYETCSLSSAKKLSQREKSRPNTLISSNIDRKFLPFGELFKMLSVNLPHLRNIFLFRMDLNKFSSDLERMKK